MPEKVCIIIPVFNEEGNIKTIVTAINKAFEKLLYDYYLLFVDDGSTDNTLNIIEGLSAGNNNIKFISFSRNSGHQVALKAGIDYSDADCTISMDGDMQHPPSLIADMLANGKPGTKWYIPSGKNRKIYHFLKEKHLPYFINY